MKLSVFDHRRDNLGKTYVYAVLSRRSGGVSIGINLNPNKACNWRCVYCQVDGLAYGKAPPIDLERLRQELADTLSEWQDHAIVDVSFSGDGEPTSALQFADVVRLVATVLEEFSLLGKIKIVLITNGSLMLRDHVIEGLKALREVYAEVWFKIDSFNEEGHWHLNHFSTTMVARMQQLAKAVETCPTFIQSCLFPYDGKPSETMENYVQGLEHIMAAHIPIQGVLLYAPIRESHQPEGSHIALLPASFFEALAVKIEELGLSVKIAL